MSLEFQVLGEPGRDNALFVRVDTGHAIDRLLFDCGEGCPQRLPISDVQAIDLVGFSHFHIDHVAGFDSFLRHNYARSDKPVRIFGPADSARMIQRRLRGFTWNMIAGTPGEFLVTEIHPGELRITRFRTSEAFAVAHPAGQVPFDRIVYEHDFYQVEAILLEHGTASVGYCVREKPRHNVDAELLQQHGFAPGAWLQTVKDPRVAGQHEIEVGGRRYPVQQLRDELLVDTVGDSIAYLTDFRLDDRGRPQLVEFLQGCRTLVCENNYANGDADLAARNYHMVSREVARLAEEVGPERLILVHLSDRYTPAGWHLQLEEVRRVFAPTFFPEHWHLD
jgi:ribonuclease Z